MQIYTVAEGDSIYSISKLFGTPASLIISDNDISDPTRLSIGRSLLIRQPTEFHTVKSGDSLFSIADMYGVTVRSLWQNNPTLGGGYDIFPGESLVIGGEPKPFGRIAANAYIYPFVSLDTLRRTLPYLSYVTVFTYGIRNDGSLIPPGGDEAESSIIALAREYGVRPLMMLSTLTEDGYFSNELAAYVLSEKSVRDAVIRNVADTIERLGYDGVDIDFEYLGSDAADEYASFVADMNDALDARGGYEVWVALAPKSSADQSGLIYEGHNYGALANAADRALLMTYEWGYAFGEPQAVAPLDKVRRVVDYAVTEAPPQKFLLGVPNYGYDWTLPYVMGVTEAESVTNIEAPIRAYDRRARIMFDEAAASPYYSYYENGSEHIVWFEDPRSVYAKASLIYDTGLYGAGIWNAMKFWTPLWLILSGLFEID